MRSAVCSLNGGGVVTGSAALTMLATQNPWMSSTPPNYSDTGGASVNEHDQLKMIVKQVFGDRRIMKITSRKTDEISLQFEDKARIKLPDFLFWWEMEKCLTQCQRFSRARDADVASFRSSTDPALPMLKALLSDATSRAVIETIQSHVNQLVAPLKDPQYQNSVGEVVRLFHLLVEELSLEDRAALASNKAVRIPDAILAVPEVDSVLARGLSLDHSNFEPGDLEVDLVRLVPPDRLRVLMMRAEREETPRFNARNEELAKYFECVKKYNEASLLMRVKPVELKNQHSGRFNQKMALPSLPSFGGGPNSSANTLDPDYLADQAVRLYCGLAHSREFDREVTVFRKLRESAAVVRASIAYINLFARKSQAEIEQYTQDSIAVACYAEARNNLLRRPITIRALD